jgi:hypothetical protein
MTLSIKIIITTIIFHLISFNISHALPVSSADDLFKIAVKSSKYKHYSKFKFTKYMAKAPIDDLYPIIKKLPYEKRIEVLYDIASKKELIKPTEVLQFYAKSVHFENYDDVLYKYIKTNPKNFKNLVKTDTTIRNGKLAGKSHPVTKVPFTKDGFPVFDSAYDVHLPGNLIKATDREQFEFATKELSEVIRKNLKLKKKFTKKQLDQIKDGKTPSGYVWHHHQDTGKLQLVDSRIHQQTGHTGGKALWGGGSDYR